VQFKSVAVGGVLLAGLAGVSHADIVQSSSNTSFNVENFLLGQSFTADASVADLESFTFVLDTNYSTGTVNAVLYDGYGYGGTVMAFDSVFISSFPPTLSPIEFDFSNESLVDGNVYTVSVESDFGLDLRMSNGNPYSGGELLDSSGVPLFGGTFDFQFIVDGNFVPEPSTLGLLGAVGVIALRRMKTNR